MNVHDSERLSGLLERDGYEPSSDLASADLVVVNTCSVRERAEDKLYAALGGIKHAAEARGTKPTIAVTGCVAQQEGARIQARAPFVDVVMGPQQLDAVPDVLRQVRDAGRASVRPDLETDVSFPLGVVRRGDPVRALVTVIEGCNEYCAFCVVPYTRGHERMRPVHDIVAEVEEAASSGRVEVVLLGQIVNHYRAPDDPDCDFPELLRRVSAVAGIDRVRFASPHPRHVTPRLIATLRDLPAVCKHLHLPVQSGSDRILERMRRRHTRADYLSWVDSARAAIPDIDLSTDLIVGFPGETDEDFDLTLDLVRRVRYQAIFSFKYSVRPNTLASKRMPDDVPEAEKTRRIMVLQALQREIQTEGFARHVGRRHRVLVDTISDKRPGELGGRTSGNAVVTFSGPSDWLGRIVDVRITASTPYGLRGEAMGSAV
ncbi:MAG: tRNA (N6-isopentenyl adenosine(37)-C2)-methylthiotransferase MiaB [Acidobacteria bacterium]|nr:tRNA (N6-isopentenyl adenosine(37)-C2)-methylthiotransferase MiaB [Acidobacteriota bacterium]